MTSNRTFAEVVGTLNRDFDQMKSNFFCGAETPDTVNHLLGCINSLVVAGSFFDLESSESALLYNFHAAAFDYLDYLDAQSLFQRDLLKEKLDKILSDAEASFIGRQVSDLYEPNPAAGIARLRFALCAASVKYSEHKLSEGLDILTKIRKILESEPVKNAGDAVNPYVAAQLCFLESKFHVRLANYEIAEELIEQAVAGYRDWERWTKESTPQQDLTPGFKDFVTYKICVAQSFSTYAYVLQGRLHEVVHQEVMIERLLEYSGHNRTRNFVKIIGARALRLVSYKKPEKLRTVLRMLKETGDNMTDYISSRKLNQQLMKDAQVRFFEHDRHKLMGLFQEGVTYFYLFSSDSINTKKRNVSGRDTHLNALKKVVDDIRNINKGERESQYWQVRSNTLETYLLLSRNETLKAISLAEGNSETRIDDFVATIEALVACAECYIVAIRDIKSATGEIVEHERLRQAAGKKLEKILELAEKSFAETGAKNIPVFGRVYLLQTEFAIIDGELDNAREAWEKWLSVSTNIENSRLLAIANRIERELTTLEDRFTYAFEGNYSVEKVQPELERFLYQQTKAKFDNDLKRIKALNISREKFYRWKNLYNAPPD